MAKSVYKIPASIDRSFLDHEIMLNPGGISMRPSPIKQLLFYGGGGFLVMWATTSTFISGSGPLLIGLFVLWGVLMIGYFGQLTKTKELRATSIPALLEYFPRRFRHVYTRRSSDPTDFSSIVCIERIDDDGRIHFADGGQGHVYLVVGSASYLLFDEDRTAILDRTDAFWRKVDAGCEWVTITTKEPQQIYRQVASLEQRNLALEYRDPDLVELQREQYDILTEHVGGKFSSIHQYLLVKGRSADALRRAHMLLEAEIDGSPLMVKEASVLDREETELTLRTFYQGIDHGPALKASLY